MTSLPLHPVLIALGSNVGDRLLHLRRAIGSLGEIVRIVRLSSVWETDPVDAPPGSTHFLNMVAAGFSGDRPRELLQAMHRIEAAMGRVRRRRNEPRNIDLDLILYGAFVLREESLTLPHPRYSDRGFVIDPLRELRLPWVDPPSGVPLARLRAAGGGIRKRSLY